MAESSVLSSVATGKAVDVAPADAPAWKFIEASFKRRPGNGVKIAFKVAPDAVSTR
jgi:hypothetical protein